MKSPTFFSGTKRGKKMNNINGKVASGDPGWVANRQQNQVLNAEWDQKLVHSVIGLFLVVCPTFEIGSATGIVSATSASSILASWYDCARPGECSRHKITASGERFNPRALTAAHRSLPFGTRVRVTHGKRSVTVRINDRGPFIRGRSLDLSRAAARAIGCGGVCRVRMTVVRRPR